MNDDWLNKIHNRMTDYETDEPDDLWDSIVENFGTSPLKRHQSALPFILHNKRAIAAGITLAIAVPIGLYLVYNSENAPRHSLLSNATAPYTIGSATKITPATVSQLAPTIPANIINKKTTSTRKQMVTISRTDDCPQVCDTIKETQERNSAKNDSTYTKKIYLKDSTTKHKGYTASVSHNSNRNRNGNITFSAFSSGATGATNSNTFPASSIGSYGVTDCGWEDAPILGILLFNKGKVTENRIHHRLPLRVGLSFTYNLNDRFGIETGITYTNLTSDIREGSEDHYIAGTQKLHYIGIPLNLKYRIYTWKLFDLYTSAGVSGEKCFSAKVDKEFIIDNRLKESSVENLSEKPMQWSVNASVGLQCNILNSLSLFAEPGISYYFNDGSTIKTIYKEKPVNFNLNIGLRYTIGK